MSRPATPPPDRRATAQAHRAGPEPHPEDGGGLADTPAEVDATFRTQRRVAVGHFTLFLLLTLGVPALTVVLRWWSEGRIAGGMSPYFVMAAAGLYVCYFLLALAYATLATAVEERMLGGPDWPAEDDAAGSDTLDGPAP